MVFVRVLRVSVVCPHLAPFNRFLQRSLIKMPLRFRNGARQICVNLRAPKTQWKNREDGTQRT